MSGKSRYRSITATACSSYSFPPSSKTSHPRYARVPSFLPKRCTSPRACACPNPARSRKAAPRPLTKSECAVQAPQRQAPQRQAAQRQAAQWRGSEQPQQPPPLAARTRPDRRLCRRASHGAMPRSWDRDASPEARRKGSQHRSAGLPASLANKAARGGRHRKEKNMTLSHDTDAGASERTANSGTSGRASAGDLTA
jgi:hypothetical protein